MAQKMYSEIQLDLEIKGYIAALEKAKQANAKLKSDYEKKINGMNKKSGDLMATFQKMAGVIGITFGGQQLIAFGKELVTLAANAQGIQNAFENLNDASLLANLRKATRGTVDDITLMTNAVQAKNLGIPLKHLSTLFQFASERARATGESVDYLVNSLVLGLGRKSTLRLDNVGLSLEVLNKRIAETGDFFAGAFSVIQEEMGKSGEYIETAADQVDRLKTSWKNLKVEVGAKLLSAGVQKELEDAVALVKALNQGENAGVALKAKLRDVADSLVEGKGGWLLAAVMPGIEAFRNADSIINKVFNKPRWDEIKKNVDLREVWLANATASADFFNQMQRGMSGGALGKAWQMVPDAPFQMAPSAIKSQTIAELKAEIQKLETAYETLAVTDTKAIQANLARTQQLKAQLDALTKLNDFKEGGPQTTGNLYLQSYTPTTGIQEAANFAWAQVDAAMAVTDQAHKQAEALALINPELEASLALYDAQQARMGEITNLVMGMEGAISSLFRSGMEGWEAFGETAKNVMKELMVKLMTLVTLYAILNILSGGTMTFAGLGKFIGEGFGVGDIGAKGGGGGPVAMGGMELKVKGTSLATATNRGTNIMWKNT